MSSKLFDDIHIPYKNKVSRQLYEHIAVQISAPLFWKIARQYGFRIQRDLQ